MIQHFFDKNFDQRPFMKSLPRLVHICEVEKSDIWPRVLHSHQKYTEIVLVREGALTIQLDHVTYRAQKGDAVVYNAGVLHDERPVQGAAFCSYVCGVSDFARQGYPVNYIPVGNMPVVSMGNRAALVESIFRLILEQTLSPERPHGMEESCQYLLAAILSSIMSALGNESCEENRQGFSLGKHIQHYLDQNYKNELNLAVISQELQISIFYLSHVFRQETGYSPMQYVINRRIGEAQNLLIQTDIPINIISQMVGCPNTNYFNQLFRKRTGFSPGRFRQNAVLPDKSPEPAKDKQRGL